MDPRLDETRPPRLVEALLKRVLPPGAVGLSILGDLREEYQTRAGQGVRRRLWYCAQAFLLGARYVMWRPKRRLPAAKRLFGMAIELRMARRALLGSSATSLLIVVTLGTAIAATTIGFTFADFALLRGLPVDDARRVVSIDGVDPRQSDGRARLSLANFVDMRNRLTTVERIAAFQTGTATLVDRGIPVNVDVIRATADFFIAMGQHPSHGRLLAPGDDVVGAEPVVVLANQYWRRVYGGDPRVLGTSVFVDGRLRAIVGVAPESLEFGNLALIDFWLPLQIAPNPSRTDRVVSVVGRLRHGVDVDAARAEIATVSQQLTIEHPDDNRDWRADVLPIRDVAMGSGFWVTMGLFVAAVTLVMIIACVNVASLVLARAMSRRRDFAVRVALGAGRLRVVRQSVIEGVALSATAALLAVPLAEIGLRAIRAIDAEPMFKQLHLDWHEVSFIAVLALITPVLFSVAPTLAAIRQDVRSALQTGSVRTGRVHGGVRPWLVVMQLAMAVTLLVSAGLALRTGVNLSRIDLGFRTSRLLTFRIDLGSERINRRQLTDEARQKLLALPGVESVHVMEAVPVLQDEWMATIQIDGRAPTSERDRLWAVVNGIDADALGALDVRLLSGRWFRDSETSTDAPVALLGHVAATQFFGSADDAIGRSLTVIDRGAARRLVIVGVVSDVLWRDLERGPVPRVWTGVGDRPRLAFAVATLMRPDDLAPGVRRTMAAIAPDAPLQQLEPFETALARYRAGNEVVIGVFVSFALLALLLVAIGLYGVVNYSVGQRVGEFGTRFALGARPRDVLLLVLAQVGRLIAIGLAAGLAFGELVGYAMRSVLYGVSSNDVGNLLTVVAIIGVVGILASAGPAIRAARVNLLEALRTE